MKGWCYVQRGGFYKKSFVHFFLIIVLGFLLICSIGFNGIQGCKLYHTSESLGQYIQQYNEARDRCGEYERYYQQAESTIGRARECNTELETILSGHTATLSDLRSQLTEVRKNYEEMEKLLSDHNSNSDN